MSARGRPSRLSELAHTHRELLEIYDALPVELKRKFFHEMLETAKALDKVIAFDEALADRAFFAECEALARAAGVPARELAIAVHPHQYESYVVRSARCKMDRYLARDGALELRIQAYQPLTFRHRLLPAPFAIHVLAGSASLERGGILVSVPEAATIDGSQPITLRLEAGARCLYVDHPLTAWIRAHLLRSKP